MDSLRSVRGKAIRRGRLSIVFGLTTAGNRPARSAESHSFGKPLEKLWRTGLGKVPRARYGRATSCVISATGREARRDSRRAAMRAMTETLPAIDPAAGRSVERLDRAREERVTELFRRWPELSPAELEELRSLWDEHIAERRRSGSRA